jgi:5-methylcytosine-specific restriction protein A
MARVEFPRKIKAEVIARAKGCCEKCAAVLKKGEAQIDHILPLELGGESKAANGQLLCKVCHAEKTAQDVRRIRKGDRQRDKASGAVKPKGWQKPVKEQRTTKAGLPPRRLYQ